MDEGRIASLHVYPLKGARGIDVARAEAAVTRPCVGGRRRSRMDGRRSRRPVRHAARVPAPRAGRTTVDERRAGAVGARYRAGQDRARRRRRTGPRRRRVERHVRGFDAGDAAADWFSADLATRGAGRALRPRAAAPCNPDYAGASGAHMRFADGYPLLVHRAARRSTDLNERLAARGAAALPMNRFRPNVVIDGLEAHDEDHLESIAIDGVVLKLVKPCTRCQVTTIDQATARVGVEPLRTLGDLPDGRPPRRRHLRHERDRRRGRRTHARGRRARALRVSLLSVAARSARRRRAHDHSASATVAFAESSRASRAGCRAIDTSAV